MMNIETSFHHKSLWFMPDVESYPKPVRYTKDDIVLVKSVPFGSPAEPYSEDLLIHIKDTKFFVALTLEHEGVGESYYDLKGARLATPEGKRLKGKQGELPAPVSDLLNRVWGSHSLQNAPKKTLG